MRLDSTWMVLPLCLVACNTPEQARSVNGAHTDPSADVSLEPTVRTEKPDGGVPYRAPAILPDAGQPDGAIHEEELGKDPSRR
ncbi:MAG: hypothetical protein KC766_03615 [Myxococcales bacterium]|nr:hypothetical protein [Myxococcales bacterium]